MSNSARIPPWIRYRAGSGPEFVKVNCTVNSLGLHTVCCEARCPNAGECFSSGTATFLIMGDTCTRGCLYCSVNKGTTLPPDAEEPRRVAEAVRSLGLSYAVITSVTRDDIADGGASIFAGTCRCIHELVPHCGIELLVPDFRDSMEHSLDLIAAAGPRVLNHNIETVREYFPVLRPAGDYDASLRLLAYASSLGMKVKSGIMIGFGETIDQVKATLHDMAGTGCAMLTVGQYLKPLKTGYNVVKYYPPDEFYEIELIARSAGFTSVMSGPNVRSSYHASSMSGGM